MGFPRQEYWSGLPFPSPGDLPYPGIKLVSPALAGTFLTTGPPGKPHSGVEMGLAEKNFYSLKVFLLLEAFQISFIYCIQKEACQYLDPVL